MESHISIRGRFFVLEDKRYMIRGVVYQPWDSSLSSNGINDVLEDARAAELQRDILLFKELHINTLFIYMFDPDKSHDIAMRLLLESGIYVFVCLSTPKVTVRRLDPYESYRPALLQHYFKAADCLSRYANVLGVIAANSIINDPSHGNTAEVIRAVVRDLKRYMAAKARLSGQRVLPVGVSNGTLPKDDAAMPQYFLAGKKEDRVDFWAAIDYSEASIGHDTTPPTWGRLREIFSELPTPVFFSELGCDGPRPRQFNGILSLYSEKNTAVFSGACVYEFAHGPNSWGLLKITAEGRVERLGDFENLKAKFSAAGDLIEKTQVAASPEILTSADDDRIFPFPEQTVSWMAGPEIPEPVLDIDVAAEDLEARFSVIDVAD